MITVTQEMVTAFMDAGTGGYGDVVDAKAGLEAVMVIVDKAVKAEANRLVRQAYELELKDGRA